jgi:hypothetical protein
MDGVTKVVSRPTMGFSRKVPLAFRVGITGTRNVHPSAEEPIRAQISQVLELISQEITKLAETPASQAVYRQQTDDERTLRLRLVSPLAEGSDRLVAEEALKAGYTLYAPLPFSQSEYERDFPDSVDEFRTLLSKADVLELDGTRELASESYREVGRFVVRNCDLLIAVWDGAIERGPGGTAEIVRFAANLGVAVWWIDASGQSAPRFVDNPQRLRASGASAAEHDDLRRHIERTCVPPKVAYAERPGAFARLAHMLVRALGGDASPLDQYLNEPELKTKGIWRAYSVLVTALTPKAAKASPVKSPYILPSGENRWWLDYFLPVDRSSEAYGNRYRSSYVLVAALAVVAAASGMGGLLPDTFEKLRKILEGIEGTAFAAIAALILANYYFRWHECWISYRLLAELFRKQAMLWTIGGSLPTQEILRSALASDDFEDGEQSALSRDAWAGWYFAAVTRSAPPLVGSLGSKKHSALANVEALIKEQIQYHRWRIVSSRAAASAMERAASLFLLIGVVVGLFRAKFWLMPPADSHSELLRALTTVVSTVSAAFVGLRAYSELPLLAQQSSRMVRILKNAESELSAIEVSAPAASWELAQTMNALALSMMQDVTGWMQLFRLKPLEAPDVQ